MLNQLRLEEAGVGNLKNYETNNWIYWQSVFFNQTVGDRTFPSGFGRICPFTGLGGHSAFWRVGERDCRTIRLDRNHSGRRERRSTGGHDHSPTRQLRRRRVRRDTGSKVPRGNRSRPGGGDFALFIGGEEQRLRITRVGLKQNLFEIENNVGDIFDDAVNGRKFVHRAVHLDGGDGRAFQRGEEHSAK